MLDGGFIKAVGVHAKTIIYTRDVLPIIFGRDGYFRIIMQSLSVETRLLCVTSFGAQNIFCVHTHTAAALLCCVCSMFCVLFCTELNTGFSYGYGWLDGWLNKNGFC